MKVLTKEAVHCNMILILSLFCLSGVLNPSLCQDSPQVSTTRGVVTGMYAKTRGDRQFLQFLGIPYAKPPIGSLRFQNSPQVSTTRGVVTGMYAKTRGHRQFLQFLGIPYAKPPIGRLRFQSPVAADHWQGVLNATKECSVCVQQPFIAEIVRKAVLGSEDCLCINVFTPDVNAKLPVIVWVPGGGFVAGSSTLADYGPDLLLDRDIVLVSMNYRVGVMGFLSAGDSVIPGNYGMKDQALSFQWVRDNIANFGGDPNSVTIFGESAGAASVGLHQYSSLSQDLFHKVIANSGSALNAWAVTAPEVLKGRTAVVAEMVGCPTTGSAAMLECLQQAPVVDIVNTTHTFLIWDIDPVVVWTPTVETMDTQNAFLTEDPENSNQAMTKPLLTGFNYAEGALKTTSMVYGDEAQKFAQWNEDYYNLAAMSLLYNDTALDRLQITKEIRSFYFGSDDKTITKDQLREITQMYGDFWFIMGVLDAAEGREGPTYLYYYNYNKTRSFCPTFLAQTNNSLNVGACHLDELPSLFPMRGFYAPLDITNTDPDYLLSLKMLDLWTNFAKSSNPSTSEIVWEQVQSDALEHLEITNDAIAMKSYPIKERRAYWNKLRSVLEVDSKIKSARKYMLQLLYKGN